LRNRRRMNTPPWGSDFMNTDKRVAWIDQVRGISILLVIFGHVWRNAYEDYALSPKIFGVVFDAIYLFHMPVFFFVSGIFLTRSLTSITIRDFLSSRFVNLIFPVIVWAITYQILRTILGQPTTARDFLIAPFRPDDMFWFIWALLLCQAVGAILLRLKRRWVIGLAAIVSAIMTIAFLPVDFSNYPFRTGLGLTVYMLGGFTGAVVTRRVWPGVVAFIAAQIIAAEFPGSIYYVAASLVATLGFLWAMAALGPKRRSYAAMAWLGRNSFPIYLIHGAVIGMHVLLIKVGITLPIAIVAIPGVLALLASVAGTIVLDRLGLGVLIGLRHQKRTRPVRQANV